MGHLESHEHDYQVVRTNLTIPQMAKLTQYGKEY